MLSASRGPGPSLCAGAHWLAATLDTPWTPWLAGPRASASLTQEAPPPAPPLPGAETEAQGGTTMYLGVTTAPGPGSGLALSWTCLVHLLDAMPRGTEPLHHSEESSRAPGGHGRGHPAHRRQCQAPPGCLSTVHAAWTDLLPSSRQGSSPRRCPGELPAPSPPQRATVPSWGHRALGSLQTSGFTEVEVGLDRR